MNNFNLDNTLVIQSTIPILVLKQKCAASFFVVECPEEHTDILSTNSWNCYVNIIFMLIAHNHTYIQKSLQTIISSFNMYIFNVKICCNSATHQVISVEYYHLTETLLKIM